MPLMKKKIDGLQLNMTKRKYQNKCSSILFPLYMQHEMFHFCAS